MPKIRTQRTIDINAPKDKVKEILTDFRQWLPWSPWLISEPEATVNYADDGKSYNWEGKRVGAGEMHLLSDADDNLEFDLIFLKPWKSKAKTGFQLKENNNTTTVIWTMDSSLPFFMFWMKKKMEVFIGMDYERGLKMLKQYVEEGKVSSQLDFLGVQDYAGTKYIGIEHTCSFNDIGDAMEKNYRELFENATLQPLINGEAFVQYHKFDMVRDIVTYTAAIGLSDFPSEKAAHWKQDELPAMKLQTVRHTGWYDYLGNPWSTVQSMIRAKEFKPKRSMHPFEFYKNNYREVSKEELVTDVCFAV